MGSQWEGQRGGGCWGQGWVGHRGGGGEGKEGQREVLKETPGACGTGSGAAGVPNHGVSPTMGCPHRLCDTCTHVCLAPCMGSPHGRGAACHSAAPQPHVWLCATSPGVSPGVSLWSRAHPRAKISVSVPRVCPYGPTSPYKCSHVSVLRAFLHPSQCVPLPHTRHTPLLPYVPHACPPIPMPTRTLSPRGDPPLTSPLAGRRTPRGPGGTVGGQSPSAGCCTPQPPGNSPKTSSASCSLETDMVGPGWGNRQGGREGGGWIMMSVLMYRSGRG